MPVANKYSTYQPLYCGVCKKPIYPGTNYWFHWNSNDEWISLCSATCESVYTLTGGLV